MTELKPWSTSQKFLGLFFILLLGSPHSAFSAQDATTRIDQVAIRDRPALDAKIIESKPVGSKIRISNFAKDGWYKTKASTGPFGWVWQADITLSNFSDDIKASNLEMADHPHDKRSGARIPWLNVRLGATMSPLIAMIGEDKGHLHIVAGGFLELSLKSFWSDNTRFATRLLTYTNLFGIAFTENSSDLSPGITGIMFGMEHDLNKGENHDFSVALYAGFNLANNTTIVQSVGDPGTVPTQISTTPLNTTPGASVVLPYNGYPILLNFIYKHYITSRLTVVGEVGFFWDYINQTDIPYFGSQHINQYGPMSSIGLQYGL